MGTLGAQTSNFTVTETMEGKFQSLKYTTNIDAADELQLEKFKAELKKRTISGWEYNIKTVKAKTKLTVTPIKDKRQNKHFKHCRGTSCKVAFCLALQKSWDNLRRNVKNAITAAGGLHISLAQARWERLRKKHLPDVPAVKKPVTATAGADIAAHSPKGSRRLLRETY